MSNSPHDALVKLAFSDLIAARALLKSKLPAKLANAIDWSSLKVESGSFVDPKFSETQCDLLFSMQVFGAKLLVYWLLEHKSYPDHFVLLQLWLYVGGVYRKYQTDHPTEKLLPGVIPYVFHHGQAPWNCPRNLQSLLAPELRALPDLVQWMPNLTYILDDIGPATNQELLARPVPVSIQFVLWALRDSRSEQCLDQFEQVWVIVAEDGLENPWEAEMIRLGLRYILEVRDDIEVEQLRLAARRRAPAVEKVVMTVGERLIEQGRVLGLREGELKGLREGELKGLREGELKGLREGRARSLVEVLVSRGLPLSASSKQRILDCQDSAELESWWSRAFRISRVEDLFLGGS